MKKPMIILLALVSCVASAQASDIFWAKDSMEWTDWTDPKGWPNETLPVDGDLVHLANSSVRHAAVRISTELPPIYGLVLNNENITTCRCEIVEGGILWVTNSNIRIGVWHHGSALHSVESELILNGGTITNVVLNAYGNPGAGGIQIGDGSVISTPSIGAFRVYGGRADLCGMGLGRTDCDVFQSYYEQTGGYVKVYNSAGFNLGSHFDLSGGTFSVGSSGTGMRNHFRMTGGTFDSSGMLTIKNNATHPDDDGAFLASGGVITNTGPYDYRAFRLENGFATVTGDVSISRLCIQAYRTDATKPSVLCIDGGTWECGTIAMNGGSVIRQTGGVLEARCDTSTFTIGSTGACRYEISGGRFSMGVRGSSNYPWGFIEIDKTSTELATFCVRGTPIVEFTQMPRADRSPQLPHFLFEIDARGLNPMMFYTGESGMGSGVAGTIKAHVTVHPYGGFQVVTNTSFGLIRGQYAITDPACYGRPDPGLWHTNNLDAAVNPKLWGVTLTNAAEIANNFASATGVPYGYFSVPYLKADRILGSYAELTLAPQGTNTLDGLVAGMVKGGYEVEVTDASAGKVKVNFAPDALGDRVTNRKLLFDFTIEAKPTDARDGIITTNALVKTFSFGVLKKGLMMLVR